MPTSSRGRLITLNLTFGNFRMTKLKNWDSHEPPDRNLCGGEISIFPLPHPLYASLAPAQAPFTLSGVPVLHLVF